MGDLVIETIISMIVSFITAIIFVKYTQNETRRLDFNRTITLLFSEINDNKNKLDNFLNHITEIKDKWESKRLNHLTIPPNWNGIWLDKVISTGFPPFIYNYLSFEYYNQMYSKGYQLELSDKGECLNHAYLFLKKFCQKTQNIEQFINGCVLKGTDFSNLYSELEKEYNCIVDLIPQLMLKYGKNGDRVLQSWSNYHILNRIRSWHSKLIKKDNINLSKSILPEESNSNNISENTIIETPPDFSEIRVSDGDVLKYESQYSDSIKGDSSLIFSPGRAIIASSTEELPNQYYQFPSTIVDNTSFSNDYSKNYNFVSDPQHKQSKKRKRMRRHYPDFKDSLPFYQIFLNVVHVRVPQQSTIH